MYIPIYNIYGVVVSLSFAPMRWYPALILFRYSATLRLSAASPCCIQFRYMYRPTVGNGLPILVEYVVSAKLFLKPVSGRDTFQILFYRRNASEYSVVDENTSSLFFVGDDNGDNGSDGNYCSGWCWKRNKWK